MSDDVTFGLAEDEGQAKREAVILGLIAAIVKKFGTGRTLALFAQHFRSQARDTVPGMRADLTFLADGLDLLAREADDRFLR